VVALARAFGSEAPAEPNRRRLLRFVVLVVARAAIGMPAG
jgi:hypothetical protein